MSNNVRVCRLLRYTNKGVLHTVFGYGGFVCFMLLFEISFSLLCIRELINLLPFLAFAVTCFTVVSCIFIINCEIDYCSKLSWVLLTIFIPLAGGLLFFYSNAKITRLREEHKLKNISRNKLFPKSHFSDVLEELSEKSDDIANLALRLNKSGEYPIYKSCKTNYYPYGEYKWEALLSDLNNAKKYIYLEYFIVEEGTMWGSILDILIKKAKDGLDVRLIYDGNCELSLLPINYPKKLDALGIKCKVFSRYKPVVSINFNFRDHRKLVVIDGNIAYTGGVNLADTYINYGTTPEHWKDTAVRLEGECVNSFSLMFLKMWHNENLLQGDELPDVNHSKTNCCGYVIPFGYSPFDQSNTSVILYSHILQNARRYVYIMTPFLALGDSMLRLIKSTAERGVDVRLIMSGIPDNKPMQALSETYYKTLLNSGVKIYRYNKGVVHAKMFLSDDTKAVVGSVNLDYRSLYHNYECGVFFYKTDSINDIINDFSRTFTICTDVTHDNIHCGSLLSKAVGSVMRVVAPLM